MIDWPPPRKRCGTPQGWQVITFAAPKGAWQPAARIGSVQLPLLPRRLGFLPDCPIAHRVDEVVAGRG